MGDESPVDPGSVIESVESDKHQRAADARVAFDWFAERGGELYDTEEAVAAIAAANEWDDARAQAALVGLVDDSIDPVQIVRDGPKAYVGIIGFEVFEAEGAYGFEEYNDTFGQRKNVVCARCVEIHDYAAEPFRAVEGVGRHDRGVGWQPMLDHVTEHYVAEHTQGPSDVDVAAALVSGTTISSSTAWHNGNVSGGANIAVGSTSVAVSPQGSGSGLNADTWRGYEVQKNGSDANGVINFKT